MKGTKWIDKYDGMKYTYQSRANFAYHSPLTGKAIATPVVILTPDISDTMPVVVSMATFHDNFSPAPPDAEPEEGMQQTKH